MEREPHELLPAMPPMVARLAGETSTGKKSPFGLSQAFSPSSTMPGSTVTRRASSSKRTTRSRCRLVSTTTASPTVCPHCEVPAPRARTGAPASRQTAIACSMSSVLRGATTPIGSIW